MAGKSPVAATDGQRAVLKAMASGADRTEADRARAILLTLSGWTSARIAEEIKAKEGVSISRSQLSKVLRKKGGSASGGRGTR